MPSIVVAPWVAQAASENPLVVIAWATVRRLRVRAQAMAAFISTKHLAVV